MRWSAGKACGRSLGRSHGSGAPLSKSISSDSRTGLAGSTTASASAWDAHADSYDHAVGEGIAAFTVPKFRQRAYLMGYRRANAQAKVEREEMADRFFSALSEIHEELNGIKDEALRLRQIDQAIATERDLRARLH